MGRPGSVAGAAADDEPAIGAATGCYFLDVVGGQVGGLAFPSWAPVPDDGAVVGDDAAAALAFFGVVVQVGAACALALVMGALAVGAAGLAAYRRPAA